MRRIIFVFLMMVYSVSWAEWEHTGEAFEFSAYHDTSNRRRNGSVVKMWTMKDFPQVQNQAGDTYKSAKIMYAFDCKQETFAIISFSRHSGSMGGGSVVYAHTFKEKDWDWEPIIPESVAEISWGIACGKK